MSVAVAVGIIVNVKTYVFIVSVEGSGVFWESYQETKLSLGVCVPEAVEKL